MLFVDTLESAFCINMNLTNNDSNYIYSFSHLVRNNTSIIRSLINNENLIVEENVIGNVTNTNIAVCYLKNIIDTNVLAEVRNKINNSQIDSVLSCYGLKKILKHKKNIPGQIITTNNPHKVVKHIISGKVAIFINGTSYALVLPVMAKNFIPRKKDTHMNVAKNSLLLLIASLVFIYSSYSTSSMATARKHFK